MAIYATLLVVALIFVGTTKSVSKYSSWASWYGPGLYGNHLACGGTLTTGTWGVAHKYMRCGTRVVLCYRRCTVASVIDRGPYIAGRDFDLTYPVKQAIGMGDTGFIRWYYK